MIKLTWKKYDLTTPGLMYSSLGRLSRCCRRSLGMYSNTKCNFFSSVKNQYSLKNGDNVKKEKQKIFV
jgi:hypothetical protein